MAVASSWCAYFFFLAAFFAGFFAAAFFVAIRTPPPSVSECLTVVLGIPEIAQRVKFLSHRFSRSGAADGQQWGQGAALTSSLTISYTPSALRG